MYLLLIETTLLYPDVNIMYGKFCALCISENGIHSFLWIGVNVSMDWVQHVFGVQSAAQIDIDRTALPELDNSLSLRVRSVITSVREQRHRCMRVSFLCVKT